MSDLDRLRDEIAKLDAEILLLISKRCLTAEEIGRLKKAEGIAIVAPDVEKRVMERFVSIGSEYNLSRDTCEKLARVLIDEAIKHEKMV